MRRSSSLPQVVGLLVVVALLAGCVAPIPVPIALPAAAPATAPVAEPVGIPPGVEFAPTRPTFATPEEAIAQYVAGVAATNLEAVFVASAIDEVAAGTDFVATADRLQVIMLAQGLAPSDYPFYEEINRAALRSRIASSVRFLAYSLLTGAGEDQLTRPIQLKDNPDLAQEFVELSNPAPLAGLELLAIGDPSRDFDSERMRTTFDAQARILGADEVVERVALLALDGATWSIGFRLARFGDNWLVTDQTSALAGFSVLGNAVPTSAEDFSERWGE